MRDWFLALPRRQQRIVIGGGIITILILLYGLVLAPLSRSTAAAAERVEQKERDLAWMRQAAETIRKASGGTATTPESGPLVVVIDRTTRAHGLAGALASSQPSGPDGIRVRFDNAAFDTLVEWLGRLQADQGIVISSANLDATGRVGLVNASLTLERPAG